MVEDLESMTKVQHHLTHTKPKCKKDIARQPVFLKSRIYNKEGHMLRDQPYAYGSTMV